jgi:hypothetical protein
LKLIAGLMRRLACPGVPVTPVALRELTSLLEMDDLAKSRDPFFA